MLDWCFGQEGDGTPGKDEIFLQIGKCLLEPVTGLVERDKLTMKEFEVVVANFNSLEYLFLLRFKVVLLFSKHLQVYF
jgi:hypothetical protein